MGTKKTRPKFEIGDEVRVARKIPTGHPEAGTCHWVEPDMDECLGKTDTVDDVHEGGNVHLEKLDWWFPPAALEPAAYGNEED